MARIHMGWLPCVPYTVSPMDGEPITQCNSISDQSPCSANDDGYCPSVMPGYPGVFSNLAGLGFAEICGPDSDLAACVPAGSPASAAGSAAAYFQALGVSPCTVASGPNAGMAVPCPTNSITVTAEDPSTPDWNRYLLIGGAVLATLLVVGMTRR